MQSGDVDFILLDNPYRYRDAYSDRMLGDTAYFLEQSNGKTAILREKIY